MALRLAILTISDAGSRGERADSSGDLIASWARERQYAVAERALIPDDIVRISATLAEWADNDRADLILTTGGKFYMRQSFGESRFVTYKDGLMNIFGFNTQRKYGFVQGYENRALALE